MPCRSRSRAIAFPEWENIVQLKKYKNMTKQLVLVNGFGLKNSQRIEIKDQILVCEEGDEWNLAPIVCKRWELDSIVDGTGWSIVQKKQKNK